MRHFILIIFIATFVPVAAFAQGVFFRIDIAKEISGKTLWAEDFPDRYYFAQDGTFLLQYAAARQGFQAGDVRAGRWHVDDKYLCLRFDAESKPVCYLVNKDPNGFRRWGKYDDLYYVEEAEGDVHFYWDRWMHGNLILTPDVWRAIDAGKSTGLSIEQYRADITNKIMRLPLGYIYHREDGKAFWLTEEQAELIKADRAALDDEAFVKGQNIRGGKWMIDGEQHCWAYDDQGEKFCSMVVEAKNGYVPQHGYFQIMKDHFIRLIGPDRLIETN